MQTLFSLIESPFHPDFSALYQKLGIAAERFDSARNLHRALQKQPPDFFVGKPKGPGSTNRNNRDASPRSFIGTLEIDL